MRACELPIALIVGRRSLTKVTFADPALISDKLTSGSITIHYVSSSITAHFVVTMRVLRCDKNRIYSS